VSSVLITAAALEKNITPFVWKMMSFQAEVLNCPQAILLCLNDNKFQME
jgi:hypothetical protein